MNYWFIYATASGAISESHQNTAAEWNNIPSGCGVVGPVDQSDATGTDAFDHPSHYTVQNGVLVKTVTDAQLLAEAKQVKIASLLQSFAGALAQGFTSTADTTSRTYGFSDADQKHWDWLRGMVLANTCPNPVMVKDINGNRVNLTPTQAGQLCTDAQNFYLTTYQHWDSKEQDAQNATTVDAVNLVTW